MILNAQANEIKITPTSIDKVGPYVVIIDLSDTFNAKTSYQFIVELYDPLQLLNLQKQGKSSKQENNATS